MRIPIENVEMQQLSFLWYPFVPFGVPTVFQGQAGYGKTTIISKITAELSHGIYPPRLRHGAVKGRGFLTEWQMEAIDYMLNNVPERDEGDAEIEPVMFNGMEIDGIDDEDDEAEIAEIPSMDRPFMRPVGDAIKSVYISRENHYGNIIRAKYEQFGGRPGYLSVEDESDGSFTTTVENIRKLTGDAKLVIIDPIFPYIEGRLSNNDDVARAMHNFDIVARETGAAYILLNNLTKSGSSADIDSMSGDGELMLSILASFAQEESLSVSENCKWRIRRDFAAGEGNSFDMYGYKIRGGEYEIVPVEADVVRKIYNWYLNGIGTGRIAIMLNAMQIPPCRGSLWNRTTIMSVLRNEKYTGNILLQKTFISDHLTKKKKVNRGELPQYYVEDSHEAIIDKAIFDRVQEELKLRAEQYETASSVVKEQNPLAQKITCGLCGKHFIRKFGNTSAKYKRPLWICQTYLARTKAACPSRRISEKVLLPILAGVLGVQEEDVMDEAYRIEEIVVFPVSRLTIRVDGEAVERHWENPSRALSWTDEMKQEAKRKERERQECLKQHG